MTAEPNQVKAKSRETDMKSSLSLETSDTLDQEEEDERERDFDENDLESKFKSKSDLEESLMSNNDKLSKTMEIEPALGDLVSGDSDSERKWMIFSQPEKTDRGLYYDDVDQGDGEVGAGDRAGAGAETETEPLNSNFGHSKEDDDQGEEINALDRLIRRSIEDYNSIPALLALEKEEGERKKKEKRITRVSPSLMHLESSFSNEINDISDGSEAIRNPSIPNHVGEEMDIVEGTNIRIRVSNQDDYKSSNKLAWNMDHVDRISNVDSNGSNHPQNKQSIKAKMSTGVPSLPLCLELDPWNELEISEATQTTDKSYQNCEELPECESGGRCAIERININRPQARNSSTKKTTIPMMMKHELTSRVSIARCRCPVGRGGLLCQRREYSSFSIYLSYIISYHIK